MKKIVISDGGKRVDEVLAVLLNYSRSKIQRMLISGHILINDDMVKNSYFVKENDVVTITEVYDDNDILPNKMDINIVYEDNDLLVIDKQNGLVVHPAVGNKDNTLVNGLIYYATSLSSINGKFRPGIVHRIDAYTTGLIMVAKNDLAHANLATQLEHHTITRKYKALVWGVIKSDTATIDAPIGRDKKARKKMCVTGENSKKAITHLTVLKRFEKVTLVELCLETGRTHQIRVHMNYIGYPIVNDPVYGRKKIIDNTGQCLHAYLLGFVHPSTKEYMEFSSSLPVCFTNIMDGFEA
ncbi:MAG: RluA family pseudouridine synthase [Bacilli bacterium]